jgi:purine-binding chemotaxis protein CheW
MSAQLATNDTFQIVAFGLIDDQKKENYAVPIEQVREIRAVESITKVPKAKSHVMGIINLRGLIIPVIDVKEKLGVGSDGNTSSKQRILIVEVNNTPTGLLVDNVDQVIRIQTKDIEPMPQIALELHNYIKGIVKSGEKLVVLLDVANLLENSSSAITEAIRGENQQ